MSIRSKSESQKTMTLTPMISRRLRNVFLRYGGSCFSFRSLLQGNRIQGIMHWQNNNSCCAFHKNYYNHSVELDSGIFIRYNGFTTIIYGGDFMFKIPELAMPRTRKVTTICDGKKEVWDDYEEAKDFFLRQMMTT